jgi:hypothetical protein
VSGKLTVVNDANGHQVAHDGHLLYTFTGDRAGSVTGQGVQNFFVATPGLAPIASSRCRRHGPGRSAQQRLTATETASHPAVMLGTRPAAVSCQAARAAP